MRVLIRFIIVGLTITPTLSFAYVGPGAGLSFVGSLLGLIGMVLLALGVILFWPIKMLIKKMRAHKGTPPQNTVPQDVASEDAVPQDVTHQDIAPKQTEK